jgi:hypothetical protein
MPVSGKKVVLWMVLAVLVLLVGVDGGLRLAGIELMQAQFERFGFDAAWLQPVGALEVAGAMLLLYSRTRLAAAAVLCAVMTGGIFAHVVAGRRPALPVTILALLLAAIWIHLDRRADERNRSHSVPSL